MCLKLPPCEEELDISSYVNSSENVFISWSQRKQMTASQVTPPDLNVLRSQRSSEAEQRRRVRVRTSNLWAANTAGKLSPSCCSSKPIRLSTGRTQRSLFTARSVAEAFHSSEASMHTCCFIQVSAHLYSRIPHIVNEKEQQQILTREAGGFKNDW